ncbi:MAG: beta-galactosidase [Ferruginibacter sp.]
MKFLLFFLLSIGLAVPSFTQTKHSFEIKDGHFLFDNKPIHIYSGEMHYARVPEAYWRQRLQMIKAMGLNTVCTYVFWNYHETAPGVWDFKTGNRNIKAFLKIAKEEGLMVILRPGPYACAEWEYGGYPWWLVKNRSLQIRSWNQPFLDSCRSYINKLAEVVKGMQVTRGGPVIMIQAENEFGSYVAQRKDIQVEDHKKYNQAIKEQLVAAGFDVPFFTSDASSLFGGGAIAGVLPTANGEGDIANLKKAVNEYHNGMGPYMVAEYYPGWLDHWGEPFQEIETKEVLVQVEKYLKADVSFNFYMVHGGTNFGFTSGANYNKEHDLQPDITSYDYDAPINEAGRATAKYNALRTLFIQYVKGPVPAVPEPANLIHIDSARFNKVVDLFSIKEKMKPVNADVPKTFEDLDQGFGYVLYSKTFTEPLQGKLEVKGLRDYALVYVNKKFVAQLNRCNNENSCNINIPAGATLDLFVENMGRINYGEEIKNNFKGIISPVFINDAAIKGGWSMYGFPMDQQPGLELYQNSYTKNNPVIYEGTFELSETGDTFLDMQQWGKGIVFVNGHNLGRYWNIGPQQTLYLPGCWLKEGTNHISVFEQLNETRQTHISSIETPILKMLKK